MCHSPQSKLRYSTNGWKQYNVALKARVSLSICSDKCMFSFAAASTKRGRSPRF